jgi:hypothetical protein
MAHYRSTTITNTGTNVTTRPAELQAVNIVNRHSAVIYVKFYNQTVATFQDTPRFTLTVAASGGLLNISRNYLQEKSFPAGMTIRVTTDATDNGNTAAATLPIIELEYSES